jgi:hypothetical protein
MLDVKGQPLWAAEASLAAALVRGRLCAPEDVALHNLEVVLREEALRVDAPESFDALSGFFVCEGRPPLAAVPHGVQLPGPAAFEPETRQVARLLRVCGRMKRVLAAQGPDLFGSSTALPRSVDS